MIKKLFIATAIATLVISCNKNEPEKIKAVEEVVVEKEVLPDMHNSQNSLDVEGIYKGVIPCADCEGIETQLSLKKDHRYVLTTKYLGRGDEKVFELEGKYAWNKEGNKITLSNEILSIDDKTQYKVGENKLIQLDLKGNEITGDLAANYILTK